MTSIDPRPLRADARRNREKILEAAAVCFAEDGPQAGMDEVAARAGVGVGTVYRHFPTKDALLADLMRRRFARLVVTAREAAATDAPDALFTFMRRSAEAMSHDAATQDAVMRANAPFEAAAAERAELEEVVGELIERGKRAGLVRSDMRVHDVPLLMGGVCSSMGAQQAVHQDWRRHLELAVDALRAREGPLLRSVDPLPPG